MKNFSSILLTGASSGIGQALALAYAAPDVRLCLTGRDAARLAAVAEACRAKGAVVETCQSCVTDRAGFEQQVLAWDDARPFDLVIANAGISGGSSGGGEDDAAFRQIMTVNLDGTFNTVNPLIPRMQARRAGQIALMGSMAGFRGMPNAPAYSVSKNAVRAYAEALRPLLREQGIGVSVICPGFVKTPLTDVNTFRMPFLMTPDRAAAIIQKGLRANKAVIAFPFRMFILARGVSFLPRVLGDWVLSKAPKKP